MRPILACLLLLTLAAPAFAAEPVGHATLDLQRILVPLKEMAMLSGPGPADEVFEEFARRTGTRPDRDLARVGILLDDPDSDRVAIFVDGRFDEAKLVPELLKEPALRLEESALGTLRGLASKDTRFLVTRERVVFGPLKSPFFADEAAARRLLDRIAKLPREKMLSVAFRPRVAMLPQLVAMLPPQAPPPVVAIVENLESAALDADDRRVALALTVADPAALESVRKMWEGLVDMAKVRFDGEERAGRAALKDAPTLKLLSPEVLGRIQAASAGRKLLETIKLEFSGKELRLVFDNPFQAPLPALIPVVGVVAAIAIPNFQKARESARHKACLANLRVIEGATELMLMDAAERPASVTLEDLIGKDYLKEYPRCPQGGVYSIELDGVQVKVTCSKHGTVE